MKILITGGAGYIGRITADLLAQEGYEVVIFDHFQTHSEKKASPFAYIKGDITDQGQITQAITSSKPQAIIHFAAHISMGESVANPKKYYDNNVLGTKTLVEAMLASGVNQLVFSSSAGVYGSPTKVPIPEDHAKEPENPYGESKLASERLLKWYEEPYGLKSISIRYFNAAGATLDGKLGEDHEPESHIIPNIIKAQLEGREFQLFGSDYNTPDGTCVRDYIHVLDLAQAHVLALNSLLQGAPSNVYNAGTGVGYSNLELVRMVEKVASDIAQIDPEHAEGSIKIKLTYAPRRPGDADQLVADVSRIKKELGWTPQYSDLETIIKTAYAWHCKK
jgi:UDP-glucose 4-epimerase